MIARTQRYTFHVTRDADASPPLGQTVCRDAPAASQIARHVIGDAITEVIVAIFLDARQRVLGFSEIARGTLNASRFAPKDVLIPALLANAASLILAHNHPSGDHEPSAADRACTEVLRQATLLIGIPLVDHLVVSPAGYYSFADAQAW